MEPKNMKNMIPIEYFGKIKEFQKIEYVKFMAKMGNLGQGFFVLFL